MRKLFKVFLALALAGTMLFVLSAQSGAVTAAQCGLSVIKKDNYTSDGKYYVAFTVTGGKPYECRSGSTFFSGKLLNASGGTVFTWSEYEVANGTTVNRNYGADWSGLATGTYTFVLRMRVYGYEWGDYGQSYNYYWELKYSYNHTKPATVNLNTPETYRSDDGTYYNKFPFAYSGAKGQTIYMEIYDANSRLVYKTNGNPCSYDASTYSLYWNGYPSSGGLKCASGNYTIKYWLGGKNPKQSTRYLNIY